VRVRSIRIRLHWLLACGVVPAAVGAGVVVAQASVAQRWPWWLMAGVVALLGASLVRASLQLKRRTAELHDACRARRELERRADHDALTGLVNRARFDALIQQRLAACRHGEGCLSVLYLDIDGFKQVNDAHGHATGDQVLRLFAARLKAAIRGSDVVARLGGDEFAALLDETSSDRAESIAKELVDRLSRPYAVERVTVHVSASIGVASFPRCGLTPHTLLAAADAAMYQAKHGGKRQCAMSCR